MWIECKIISLNMLLSKAFRDLFKSNTALEHFAIKMSAASSFINFIISSDLKSSIFLILLNLI